MTIEQELEEAKARFLQEASPETWEAVKQTIADLINSKQAQNAVAAGRIAPPFALEDMSGKLFASHQLLAKGPLVVIFLRGISCPFCSVDLASVEQSAASLRESGASIVAIVPEPAADVRTSLSGREVSFPVLSDANGDVAEAYGLNWTPSARQIVARPARNESVGSLTHPIPIPARFVIATDGVVAYSDIDPNFTRRPDAAELIQPTQRLTRRAPRTGVDILGE